MQTPKFRKPVLAVAIALLTACSASRETTTDTSAVNTQGQASTSVTSPTPTPARSVEELVIQAEEVRISQNQATREREAQFTKNAPATMTADAFSVTGSRMNTPGMPNQENTYIRPRENTENYADFDDTGLSRVALSPVSTFSIDVDTGAYSNTRRFLNNGQLPPEDAVRAEEFINYFAYDYPVEQQSDVPFQVYTEIAPSPFNEGKHLLHVGIKAVDTDAAETLNSNLVFLVDVSGSMNSPDKLELLKTSLKMLTRQLSAEDSISLVVYAGASGVVLEPTAGNETVKISAALDRLQAGGGTNGAAGIELAYSLAQQNFIEGGVNRVIIATDGDFNVGISNFDDLIDMIEDKRVTGIGLTTLGFGTGNYNDHLMEQLADAGNGNYAYIDNLNEARKVLVDEGASTLQTVAKDVKIQIEFNPVTVSEYRLVGYENRLLATEDFNNDKVDAGEIGAGHTVTAIYEISLVGSNSEQVDPLRYGNQTTGPENTLSLDDELAYLKLRYKQPDSDSSILVERPIQRGDIENSLDNSSETYRFSAAVAGFAQLLRDNRHMHDCDYDALIKLATESRGDDPFGYRSEFINLVKTAQALSPSAPST
jgi:Ca-activated chloride channel family protein